MEAFLRSIERQAYRMAVLACRNQDDALDIVQEAMCSFVAKYSAKPADERRILFYRILQNKIRDYYRREKIRNYWCSRFAARDEDDEDPLEQSPDVNAANPEQNITRHESFARLENALQRLSPKQRQVFLLRAWEELSVQETARIMACSEGTVKTHFSRANEQLRNILGDEWP